MTLRHTFCVCALLLAGCLFCTAALQTPRQSTLVAGAVMVRPAPVVHTNLLLVWDWYTNVWFRIDRSRDLVHWQINYATVPIDRTNVVVPMDGPQAFYRMCTVYR